VSLPRAPGARAGACGGRGQGLTQAADSYDNKAAHVELAKKMMKRDAATAPTMGDRVAFVIVKARRPRGAAGRGLRRDPMVAWLSDASVPSCGGEVHHGGACA
jgi:hypothetical protein